jgi:TPR repeat protein
MTALRLLTIIILVGVSFLLAGCKTAANKESDIYRPPVFAEDVETNFDGKSSIYSLQSGIQHSNPVAEAILGYYMLHGIHVPQDVDQGVRLIRSSAEQGFVHGMEILGNLDVNGKFVPQDCVEGLHWLHLAADQNDPDAERDMGMCYEAGFGVETNCTTAATWYLKAAEQTNYVAMKDLAVLYMNGTGVPKDYEAAKHWLLWAAEKGNYARAMYDLGVLGDSGAFGTNSQTEAFKWYQRSAGMGDPLGCWGLAMCYRNGTGVPKDMAKYIFWTDQAASQGHYIAQFNLGEAYRVGYGVPQNIDTAMSWYRSAATNNYPPAFYFLALRDFEDKTNHEAQVEAYRYFLLAAQAGNAEAQFQYAMACFIGNIIPQDFEQGKQWLERSGESGWPKAEFVLSELYFAGKPPFSKDEVEGLKWLRQAAEHDHLEAQWGLGMRLMKGIGVAQDSAEAMKWWYRAAEYGNAKAQGALGYALENHDAGKIDLVEACMWDQLAANQGLATSKINLERVVAKLSDEQHQEAMHRVDDFRPKPVVVLNPVSQGVSVPELESPPPMTYDAK